MSVAAVTFSSPADMRRDSRLTRALPANFFPQDPDENAASLANLGEILFACLDAAGAKTVVEIGALHGKSTNSLLDWAARNSARLIAIDPEPQPGLEDVVAANPELEFVQATSHEALPELAAGADAIIIDGDHNYFTLSGELRIISERAPGGDMPLLLLHDIGWPLARRDAYYVPDRIPAEHRQPLAHDTHLVFGDPGTADEGMPFDCVAAREGGPRNGVLTAIEDFLSACEDELRFAQVPAFFGFGAIWHSEAPWADAVAAATAPWDRNPVLERLERNRILQMSERYRMTRLLERTVDAGEYTDQVLGELAQSRALGVAEKISRASGRGRPAVSRDVIRKLLADRRPDS